MTQHLSREDTFVDQSAPFSLLRRNPQVPYPLHSHDFTELVLVYGGHGVHFTADNSYELSAGDVFIVTPGLIHGYKDIDQLHLVNLLYDANTLHVILSRLRTIAGYHALFRLEPLYRQKHNFTSRLRLEQEQIRQADSIIVSMERELQKKQEGYAFMATAYFMQLLGFISRCYGSYKGKQARPVLRLAAAVSHIEQNFTQQISLEDLAKRAHMSQNSFLRAFKKAFDNSPIAYQMHLRMEYADELLANPEMNITEVAVQCGFEDSNYFSRQFKKHSGISPSAYRTQRQQNV